VAERKRTLKIYLAGPLGFSEAGRVFHNDVVVSALEKLGHEVLDPFALADAKKVARVTRMPFGAKRRDAWKRLNREIGARNRRAIDESDMLFAILDGVDVDSGTAAEIGYAFARGKPVLGYRGDFRLSADNEGSTVNLQVEYFIRESGGEIITRISDLKKALERIRKRPGQRSAARLLAGRQRRA
jgi:nucleoside 2-deoxyribosyltransferase